MKFHDSYAKSISQKALIIDKRQLLIYIAGKNITQCAVRKLGLVGGDNHGSMVDNGSGKFEDDLDCDESTRKQKVLAPATPRGAQQRRERAGRTRATPSSCSCFGGCCALAPLFILSFRGSVLLKIICDFAQKLFKSILVLTLFVTEEPVLIQNTEKSPRRKNKGTELQKSILQKVRESHQILSVN